MANTCTLGMAFIERAPMKHGKITIKFQIKLIYCAPLLPHKVVCITTVVPLQKIQTGGMIVCKIIITNIQPLYRPCHG